MQETNPNYYDGEINLKEIFNVLINGKRIIFSVATSALIIGIVYSLVMPNKFESKAILVAAESSGGGISGALQSYSGLASLAGINLPGESAENNSAKALKKISSLSFFEKNVLPNIFLPDLMAIKSWDHKSNEMIYDQNIYNITSNKWTRNYSYPKLLVPSAQESFKEFKKIMSLSEDNKTGFVTLTLKHQSPFIAKEWTELIVREINSYYRQKDKLESQKAVTYLNEQISMTNLSEIKEAIAELLQQETQKLTLIEAKQFYVFDYIDPPAVMERKSEPKRFLIIMLATFIGISLGVLITFISHYLYKD